MLTDKEIKQHEINLTSGRILAAYQTKKETAKPRFSWKKFFAIALPSTLATATAASLAVFFLTRPGPTPQISNLLAAGEGDRISTAVVSSLYLLKNGSSSTSPLMRKLAAATPSEFSKVVDVYEEADSVIQNRVSATPEKFKDATNVDFTGKYGTYHYQITIEGNETVHYHFNYEKNSEKVSFEGEVTYGGQIYQIEGKNKIEGNEAEYEYTARLDKENYVTIEETKEVDEYAYEYTRVKDGNEVYSFSYEKSEEIELKFLTNGLTYEYQINFSQAIWSIEYDDGSLSGIMTLERTSTTKIYTDEATGEKIIKSFQ
jgi:hypothetical protein